MLWFGLEGVGAGCKSVFDAGPEADCGGRSRLHQGPNRIKWSAARRRRQTDSHVDVRCSANVKLFTNVGLVSISEASLMRTLGSLPAKLCLHTAD